MFRIWVLFLLPQLFWDTNRNVVEGGSLERDVFLVVLFQYLLGHQLEKENFCSKPAFRGTSLRIHWYFSGLVLWLNLPNISSALFLIQAVYYQRVYPCLPFLPDGRGAESVAKCVHRRGPNPASYPKSRTFFFSDHLNPCIEGLLSTFFGFGSRGWVVVVSLKMVYIHLRIYM